MPPDLEEDAEHERFMLRISFDMKLAYGYYAGSNMVALWTSVPVPVYMKIRNQTPKCPKSKLFAYMRPYEIRLEDKME